MRARPESGAGWAWPALLLIALTLALRLGVLLLNYQADPGRIIAVDTSSYEQTAAALLDTGRFALSPDKPTEPDIFRTPGYPLFIAGIYSIFGRSLLAVAVAQVLLSGAVLAMVYGLANMLWGGRAALAALLLLCLDTSSFLYSQMILSEALFTFFLMAMAVAAARFFTEPRPSSGWVFLAGALLALATWTRPVSYYLIAPLSLLLFIHLRARRLSWIKTTACLLLFILPWMALVGGWRYRNQRLTGYSRYSHIEGLNLMRYGAADVVAQRDGISREQAERKLLKLFDEEIGSDWSTARVYELYARRSLEIMRQHPLLVAKGLLRGAVAYFLVPGISDLALYLGVSHPPSGPVGDLARLSPGEYWTAWLRNHAGILLATFLALAYLLCVYAGMAVSLFSAASRPREQLWLHLFLWCVIAYMVAISCLPGTYERMRSPLMPLFCLYAGWGWAYLTGGRGEKGMKAL